MKRLLNNRGLTMAELLISAALIALLTMTVIPIFTTAQNGMSSSEARNAIKVASQSSVNIIQHRLVESKRIFQNTTADNGYVAQLQMTGVPSALSGSKLATILESYTLAAATSSEVAAAVGNRLLFASVDDPVDVTVLDQSGSSAPVRVDTYRFNYYFLAEDSSEQVMGKPKLELWEWKSIRYADRTQLQSITDSTKSFNASGAVAASGVTYAWSPSVTASSAAFSQLNIVGGMTSAGAHVILKDTAERMFELARDVTLGGFRHGISRNTSGYPDIAIAVPRFGVASSEFPAGFEVIAVGPSSGRQVFLRLAVAAQGSFKGTVTHEQVVLASARDLW